MKKYSTGQYPLTERKGYLTLKSSARRHLSEHVDARDEMLVFLWGNHGAEREPHWLVSTCRQASLPKEARRQGVQGRIGETAFLVVQPQHLPKLDGRTLVCEAGILTVR